MLVSPIELAQNKMPTHWSHVYGAESVDADTYRIVCNGIPVVGAVYPKNPSTNNALPGVERLPIRFAERPNTKWATVQGKKLKYPKHAFVD
jgi:hypothetical protein